MKNFNKVKKLPTLYLVSYIGFYPNNECDHSHRLFTNEKDAIKDYNKAVRDCISYYKKELEREFDVWYNKESHLFSLRCTDDADGKNDSVDIYIKSIKADGQLSSIPF